ncbi:citrulline utilization hydrolase CtlX [Tanticharoenia sakaeratensis]|uniref:Amidinotransferase n=1 Tax=Tanticharoenia sakaeratensis NBRC 103193 TaxID=1231623 RepID=A0A0D6MLL2_9PROT|nr:arginine deiminase-related protein [Tanticharoenia sakaeratensis]GAN54564.1 amidinotransferase [Tanticharoenia sakaeratensis NBRC 103193]GBQ24416.1 amidinotransferase [Tanticharoenia sakaeratensis NBRC 103193]
MIKFFSVQAPAAVVMIRPHHFHSNPETADDNVFQIRQDDAADARIAAQAHAEVSTAAEQLQQAGIAVHLFEDEGRTTPDSVFPNNWFSTHAGGHIAIYPMFSPSRRHERRMDVIEFLKRHYRVQDVIDYSGLEQDGIALEGTGSMVLDHIQRIAYAARSNRTNEVALERFCTHFNFEPMFFNAADATGHKIYHTNVMMCVGTAFTLIGLDTIVEPERRREVAARLSENGRDVIDLTHDQIAAFAGNAIELAGSDGPVLALSQRAFAALRPDQIATIEQSARLLPLSVPTIELAGGSVRCMLAGVHLTKRPG